MSSDGIFGVFDQNDLVRRLAQVGWMLADLGVMAACALAASLLLGRPIAEPAVGILTVGALVRLGVFVKLGMYRSVLRSTGIHTLVITVIGAGAGSLVAVALAEFLHLDHTAQLGRAFVVLELLLAVAGAGGLRLAIRHVFERLCGGGPKTLIFGAGALGEMAVHEVVRSRGARVIGFIDDDPRLQRAIIHGRPVIGTLSDLDRLILEHDVGLVVIALPELGHAVAQKVFRTCMTRQIQVLVMQGMSSPFSPGAVGLNALAIEDLLRRPSRCLSEEPVRGLLMGKSVMVTGGGGSIGLELCRQVARLGCAKVVVVEQNEFNAYRTGVRIEREFPDLPVSIHLGDLRTPGFIREVFRQHPCPIIFHAAAYKHVPLVEVNACEALANNILGFRNLLDACGSNALQRLVLISSDKAVRPSSIMGASKRACELLLQARVAAGLPGCAVRFGNVLGSSGSVVPRFLEQIANGGPVTVTHPEVTRYFMLLGEAVALVLQAAAIAKPGELFILNMGEPIRIADMARHLIALAGRRPGVDVRIAYTGLRPGEKLHEELMLQGSETATEIDDVWRAGGSAIESSVIESQVGDIITACACHDREAACAALAQLVPEWIGPGPIQSQ